MNPRTRQTLRKRIKDANRKLQEWSKTKQKLLRRLEECNSHIQELEQEVAAVEESLDDQRGPE